MESLEPSSGPAAWLWLVTFKAVELAVTQLGEVGADQK